MIAVRVRRILAGLSLLAVTALFLDMTGVMHAWLGWMAKLQLLPAVMAGNLAVIAGIAVVTLVFGRIYCSLICPLGIFQDGVSWLSGMRSHGRKRLRFGWLPERKWLRYGVLGLFVLALVSGVSVFVAVLAPYSAYGRIVGNLLQPLWLWSNNLLAKLAEHYDSYAFYTRDVWLKSLPALIVAAVTFVVLSVLAWWKGRVYCNTICPVGAVLGLLSRFAMFRPVIDAAKCRDCRMCEKGCKASCIDVANHRIDYSRCVDCLDCLGECKFDALKYRFAWGRKTEGAEAGAGADLDHGRRAFIVGTAMVAGTVTLGAQRKKFDGGLAALENKREPRRTGRLVPPGARSANDFYSRCTACGLCVAACPNGVLRPSGDLEHLMQPYMSYERGYCRPECSECSLVCPTGAILPIRAEQKAGISIGTAEVNYDLCVVNRDGVNCGNCASHCPTGAIHMVAKDPGNERSLRIPSVDTSACIGCGRCEYLCPSRPYSAIHVNGRENHIEL